MKKYIYIIVLLNLVPSITWGQLTIHKAEDFSVGTVLKFQQCDFIGVYPGAAGANKTWDFSTLTIIQDTTTEWMVTPASTPKGNLFPTANLVEKYSDGSFVYLRKTADSNFLVGFYDSANNITMHYPNDVLFALRPISYGNTITDNFSDNYVTGPFTLKGRGNTTIEADGYGTLILPNNTYNNVLRVKITQIQYDTVIATSTPVTVANISYVWFDDAHTSGLLKIDSTRTPSYSGKTVAYLISEYTSIAAVHNMPVLHCYPNPATQSLTVDTRNAGTLTITNALGETVMTVPVNEPQTVISTTQLSPGVYTLMLQSEHIVSSARITVVR